ncbi:MAG: hypothetical protein JSR72_00105 [Proteobacteria bacterium]|nr:hypothetical protein [Pseudomonadota bacterium]
MQKFAIAILLAAASFSTATAKTMHQPKVADSYASSAYRGQGTEAMARASSPDVYSYGEYLGTDPDLNIRAGLLRDPLLKIR